MSDIEARLAAALGRSYRLDRELGAGGMATVYLAHGWNVNANCQSPTPCALRIAHCA